MDLFDSQPGAIVQKILPRLDLVIMLLPLQNNDFLGTCAIVPQYFNNDLGQGTRKILTAAHNLKKIGPNE